MVKREGVILNIRARFRIVLPACVSLYIEYTNHACFYDSNKKNMLLKVLISNPILIM